ncbi:hypothetical protein NLJ89_g7139 [Agrocybe chaxingu]|uniref:DUF1308 domain-containing protein n=1 Tax=Agrocybe chaxingu TaxID=84603 RepID=A0A9W8JWY2_9AGAR|nr:hypothetical protein NLJ89_g7139 [Agrocybe chaxingu]
MESLPHPDLQEIRSRLLQIHDAISNFKPLTPRPPILDSSFDASNDVTEENQWLHQENVPGLKKLKENIKIDLGILDKFLNSANSANLPPLSTNAPYIIAVWNEVLCAPEPIASVFKTFQLKPSRTSPDKALKRIAHQQRPPGAKVDVVGDNGRLWTRVNTIKNPRLLSEFREIDSYLTDSGEGSADDDWDHDERPSLAQTEFNNSVLRMGRSLIEAAKANLVEGTTEIPRIILRLTRLDPQQPNDDGSPPDPRIAQTINELRNMGIGVQLGERTPDELSVIDHVEDQPSFSPLTFAPTTNINLDLSILIALISDLTHAPLPTSLEEANKRFIPPQEYREWKQKKQALNRNSKKLARTPEMSSSESPAIESDINDLPRDFIRHARALTNQLLQEMSKGLIQEIHNQSMSQEVTFWTTAEARDRCMRIVSKIGGIHEKRRARALFCLQANDSSEISLEDAQKLYWQDSRFPLNFIPLLPIHIFPGADVATSLRSHFDRPKSEFEMELSRVCTDILSQEMIPHPRALPQDLVITDYSSPLDLTPSQAEIQRACVTKASPRLTAHTVDSMRWGADLGWTTLTANRSSVKAILRELRMARVAGRFAGMGKPEEADTANFAAIWIVDPRSLAEGQQSSPR